MRPIAENITLTTIPSSTVTSIQNSSDSSTRGSTMEHITTISTTLPANNERVTTETNLGSLSKHSVEVLTPSNIKNTEIMEATTEKRNEQSTIKQDNDNVSTPGLISSASSSKPTEEIPKPVKTFETSIDNVDMMDDLSTTVEETNTHKDEGNIADMRPKLETHKSDEDDITTKKVESDEFVPTLDAETTRINEESSETHHPIQNENSGKEKGHAQNDTNTSTTKNSQEDASSVDETRTDATKKYEQTTTPEHTRLLEAVSDNRTHEDEGHESSTTEHVTSSTTQRLASSTTQQLTSSSKHTTSRPEPTDPWRTNFSDFLSKFDATTEEHWGRPDTSKATKSTTLNHWSPDESSSDITKPTQGTPLDHWSSEKSRPNTSKGTQSTPIDHWSSEQSSPDVSKPTQETLVDDTWAVGVKASSEDADGDLDTGNNLSYLC